MSAPDAPNELSVQGDEMGNLTVPAPKNKSAEMIVSLLDRMLPVIPPGSVTSRQFCVAVVSEANALSRPCSPKSVAMAAFNCAVLGLIPGSALGHAYFVPFKNECTLIIGYRGFTDLAFSTGFLRDIHANVVCSGESFEHWVDRDGPQVKHAVPLDRHPQQSNVDASYCVYHTVKGGHGLSVVPKKELMKLAGRGNVWLSDFAAMAKKTAIRRAAKEWQITHRLGLAIELDEQAERGEQQTCPIDASQATPAATFGDYDEAVPYPWDTDTGRKLAEQVANAEDPAFLVDAIEVEKEQIGNDYHELQRLLKERMNA